MNNLNSFFELTENCITQCISLLHDPLNCDIVITRLESVLLAADMLNYETRGMERFRDLIVEAIERLQDADTINCFELGRVGRPRVAVDIETVAELLSMRFTTTKIAEMMRISVRTIKRRMKNHGISVRIILH
jgi:DNA invertase Pin-like site-specific DNA recombinase